MSKSSLPTQPPSFISDVSYAAWLQLFAENLPNYAEQYQLTSEEVSDVQRIAADFSELLAHYISENALSGEYPARLAAPAQGKLPDNLLPSGSLLLFGRVAAVVQRIQSHPAYNLADGYALGLAAAPLLHGYHRLPLPKLRIAQRLTTCEAPSLLWINRRDTTIEIEVCRDGLTWIPLHPSVPKHYTDTHPLPETLTEWQYRARYRSAEWPVSRWCRPIIVQVGGCE